MLKINYQKSCSVIKEAVSKARQLLFFCIIHKQTYAKVCFIVCLFASLCLYIKDVRYEKNSFQVIQSGSNYPFSTSLDEKIPQNSPVRFINQIVDNLNITEVFDTCKGGGTSAYHPHIMLKVLLYSCLNNMYSCRKIEQALQDRVSFIWLSGNQTSDHNTINRFRSSRLKNTIHEIFTQVVLMLVEMGHLSLEVIYVDGTKLESRANRYAFVWRKTVEKN